MAFWPAVTHEINSLNLALKVGMLIADFKVSLKAFNFQRIQLPLYKKFLKIINTTEIPHGSLNFHCLCPHSL